MTVKLNIRDVGHVAGINDAPSYWRYDVEVWTEYANFTVPVAISLDCDASQRKLEAMKVFAGIIGEINAEMQNLLSKL